MYYDVLNQNLSNLYRPLCLFPCVSNKRASKYYSDLYIKVSSDHLYQLKLTNLHLGITDTYISDVCLEV